MSRFMRKLVVNVNGSTFSSYRTTNRGDIDPTGFRIDFDAEAGLKNGPDKTTVVIYNPPLSVAQLLVTSKKRAQVQLFAGYDVPPTLYATGQAIKNGISLDWAGTDYILKLQFADGIRNYQTGRVSLSMPKGSTSSEVIAQAAFKLGLPLGAVELEEDIDYPRGFTGFGSARQVLDELARASRSSWTIQNGKLVFVGKSRTTGRIGRKFSYDNGSLYAPPTPQGGGKFTFDLDWEPTMKPGSLFAVEAGIDLGSGYYKALTVKAAGSSITGDFKMTVEARRLDT